MLRVSVESCWDLRSALLYSVVNCSLFLKVKLILVLYKSRRGVDVSDIFIFYLQRRSDSKCRLLLLLSMKSKAKVV